MSKRHYMARFYMTEDEILDKVDLMTLDAVVNMADPAAAPLVVFPPPICYLLTLSPAMGWQQKFYENACQISTISHKMEKVTLKKA